VVPTKDELLTVHVSVAVRIKHVEDFSQFFFFQIVYFTFVISEKGATEQSELVQIQMSVAKENCGTGERSF
jgi:hypothetical protein